MKRVTLFSPILSVNGSLSFLTDIDIDFGDNEIVGTSTYTPPSAGVWGSSTWGTSVWGSGTTVVQTWTSPIEYPGKYISGKLKVANDSLTIRWMACQYAYEVGGPVG
jgi:hypothetical protein